MGDSQRTYLVVVDDSEESRVALRFAARRAAKTNGRIEVLGIVEPQDFVQFGGVQAAMEEEQRLRIEGVVSSAIGVLLDESGISANIIIRQGEVVRSVREYIAGRDEGSARAAGRELRWHGRGPAALPADGHPRLADRRAAGAAELKHARQDFA